MSIIPPAILINRKIEHTLVSSSWSVTFYPGSIPAPAGLGLHSARAFQSTNGISASVRKLIFKSPLNESLERAEMVAGGYQPEQHA